MAGVNNTFKASASICGKSCEIESDAVNAHAHEILDRSRGIHSPHLVREIRRVLKPRGRLVLTVPSNASQPVLEFLAYRVGIVSEAKIRDHKRYYNRKSLGELFDGTGLDIETHRYFQLGMNNFLVARKQS